MGKESIIAWTNHTFNPVWGCSKVSEGCSHCYAESLANRSGHDVWGKNKPRRTFGENHWNEPKTWNTQAVKDSLRRRVFCGSMCDWCEDHPTTQAEIKKLWPIIRNTPQLDWLLLTKRPERIKNNLPPDYQYYQNLWIGTTIENIQHADRADHIRDLRVPVRFVSYEPALGPLDDLDLTGIDWVIYGGESGSGYRQHDLAWPRAMHRKCQDAGTAFFFKQSPGIRTGMGETLDGQMIREYPVPRLVEFCLA